MPPTEKVMLWLGVKDYLLSKSGAIQQILIIIIFLLSLLPFFFLNQTTLEGLPGVLGEQGIIGKISKGTREPEPIFREQGNKTLRIRGQKHGKQIY